MDPVQHWVGRETWPLTASRCLEGDVKVGPLHPPLPALPPLTKVRQSVYGAGAQNTATGQHSGVSERPRLDGEIQGGHLIVFRSNFLHFCKGCKSRKYLDRKKSSMHCMLANNNSAKGMVTNVHKQLQGGGVLAKSLSCDFFVFCI